MTREAFVIVTTATPGPGTNSTPPPGPEVTSGSVPGAKLSTVAATTVKVALPTSSLTLISTGAPCALTTGRFGSRPVQLLGPGYGGETG